MNHVRARHAILPCLALTLLVGLLASGCGEDEGPKVLEITPAKHDFGRVRHGLRPTATFTIENVGDTAVTIPRVEGSCACFAAAPLARQRLDPGDTVEMHIKFLTDAVPAQRLRGKFMKVFTDHPDAPLLRVPLEGEIFTAWTATIEGGLDKFYFGRMGSPDSLAPRVLRIRPARGFTVKLDTSRQRFERGFGFNPPKLAEAFEVEIAPKEGGYDVELRLKEGADNPGRAPQIMGTITVTLRVSGPGMPEQAVHASKQLTGTWVE